MGREQSLPPMARQILVAWMAAWPTLTLVLALTQPFTGDWPLPLRSLLSASCMVLLMNLVSVPLIRNLMKKWL